MYINSDIAEIKWDTLDGWVDEDSNGGVSSLDFPYTQLYLNLIGATDDAIASRSKDIGTIGTGDYYIEIRFKGDVWDGYAGNYGFRLLIDAGSQRFLCYLGNGYSGGDGLYIDDGTTRPRVIDKTWDNEWHTLVFYIHNSQTDCDIWVDKDPSEAADVTDADCSDQAAATDGLVVLNGAGSVAGDGEYHIDYILIGSDLNRTDTGWCQASATGETYNDFDNGDRAYITDDNYAVGGQLEYQDYYNFDFSVPSGVKILGIEVSIEAKVDTSECGIQTAVGNPVYSAIKNNYWPPDLVDYTKTYGGSTDLWGKTWDSDDFTNANFRVRFQANFAGGGTCLVDQIKVKVYYLDVLSGLKSINGVAVGSIKSVNSIDSANLKSVN